MPIIGVGQEPAPALKQLGKRARESLTEYGGVDPAALPEAVSQLRSSTAITPAARPSPSSRRELGGATRPLHYLAIPPSMFPG